MNLDMEELEAMEAPEISTGEGLLACGAALLVGLAIGAAIAT